MRAIDEATCHDTCPLVGTHLGRLLLSAVFAFVLPKDHGHSGVRFRYVPLCWFHAVLWLLLVLSFLLRATESLSDSHTTAVQQAAARPRDAAI